MSEEIDMAEIDRLADDYLKAMTQRGRFSGSVLVARNGTVLYQAGHGLADREHEVANTTRTKFRLASVTKQFTATAVLMLAEQGKLSVQDTIATHLPYAPDTWREVTIHHLLSHTSGIPNLTDFVDFETTGKLPLSLPACIETFQHRALLFRPGCECRYSNSGYLLLGDIIERVSGMSYEEFLRTSIFDPLEMADSGYDHHESILPHRATGYAKRGTTWERSRYLDMGFPYAAGALYSTVEDMYRWDQAIQAGSLLSPESWVRMTTITPLLSTFGYGFILGKEHGRRSVGHSGGIHGFRTQFTRFPDEPACVIVLCNSEAADSMGVARALTALLFGEKCDIPAVEPEITIAEDLLASYVGDYQILPGVTLAVRSKAGHLIVRSGAIADEFIPQSETTFARIESRDRIIFFTGDNGAVTHLILQQGDAETEARRIGF